MTNVDINKINITTYSTNRDIHFKENTSPRQHKNESVDPPHSLPKYYKTLRKAKKGGTLGSLKYFQRGGGGGEPKKTNQGLIPLTINIQI